MQFSVVTDSDTMRHSHASQQVRSPLAGFGFLRVQTTRGHLRPHLDHLARPFLSTLGNNCTRLAGPKCPPNHEACAFANVVFAQCTIPPHSSAS